jgi:hypothetical protein
MSFDLNTWRGVLRATPEEKSNRPKILLGDLERGGTNTMGETTGLSERGIRQRGRPDIRLGTIRLRRLRIFLPARQTNA